MKRLKVGQKAPMLTGMSYSGEKIDLKEKLDKPLLLSFYRYAGCQFCNLRINAFLKKYYPNNKQDKFNTIAVFQSPIDKLSKNLYVHHDIPFDIISDPKLKWYKAYRVELAWSKFARSFFKPKQFLDSVAKGYLKIDPDGPPNRIPADFIITTEGVIDYAFYGKDIGDHIPFKTIDNYFETK